MVVDIDMDTKVEVEPLMFVSETTHYIHVLLLQVVVDLMALLIKLVNMVEGHLEVLLRKIMVLVDMVGLKPEIPGNPILKEHLIPLLVVMLDSVLVDLDTAHHQDMAVQAAAAGMEDLVLPQMDPEMTIEVAAEVQDMYIHHLQLKIILKDVCLIRHIILLTLKL